MFVLNKFFFKILSESNPSTNNIWKSFFETEEVIDEIELQSFLKEIDTNDFDKKMNAYYLFFKVFYF